MKCLKRSARTEKFQLFVTDSDQIDNLAIEAIAGVVFDAIQDLSAFARPDDDRNGVARLSRLYFLFPTR